MAMAFLRLALVLITVGISLCLVVIYLMARTLLRPARMTDGKAIYLLKRLSPEDLGLPFEGMQWRIIDEQTGQPMKIASWWIPSATSDRCAVLIHGYGDAKVGGIAW